MVKPLRGEVEHELAGKKYKLRLGIGELEEIENATGLGTLALLNAMANDAKISHAVAVLAQAIVLDGKSQKAGTTRARAIVEDAGFGPAIMACVSVLTSVLVDPSQGNADAVGETVPPTA